MSRVRIRRVTVEAFRSFVERQSTPLLPRNGVVGIRGHNLDTNGSSGAGKSSIAYAIAFALGLLKAPYTANKLKSKWTKTPMQVDLEMEVDDMPVLLRRGKVTSIRVGNEPEVSGVVEAVETRLRALLGLDSDLLRALTFRQQKKPGMFLAMKDSAKKEFLSALLGLEEVEKQIEEATPRANKLKAEADAFEGKRQALESHVHLAKPVEPVLLPVNELLARREPLVALVEVAEKRVAAQNRVLREVIEAAPPAPEVDKIQAARLLDLHNIIDDCDRRINNARKEYNAATARAQAELLRASDAVQVTSGLIGQEGAVRAELAKVDAALKSLLENKCPTCQQTWVAAQAKKDRWLADQTKWSIQLERIESAKLALVGQNEAVRAAKLAMSAANNNTAIEQLLQTRAEVQRRVGELEAQRVQQIAAAQSTHRLAVSEATTALAQEKQTLVLAQLERSRAEAAVREVETQNKRSVVHYQEQAEICRKLEAELAAQTSAVAKLEKQAALEGDYALALKTFLGAIFEEVLNEISAEANELLLGLKNVATTTISFVTDKTTEKGAVKQQIRAVVQKNGVELDWEVDLSGGQGTSLELAVDLAVARVIGRRTGSRPGWMILDEAFEGHDMAVKESCLEVLQQAADDCTILVVDHASELQEYFSAFVDVESTNERSRIVA